MKLSETIRKTQVCVCEDCRDELADKVLALEAKAGYAIDVLRNMSKDDIVDYIEETWPD